MTLVPSGWRPMLERSGASSPASTRREGRRWRRPAGPYRGELRSMRPETHQDVDHRISALDPPHDLSLHYHAHRRAGRVGHAGHPHGPGATVVDNEIARARGNHLFVWMLLTLGVTGLFSPILSVRGLWSLRRGRPR